MKRIIPFVLLAGLFAIPVIMTKINNAKTTEKISFSVELSQEKGMSEENYRDIYLLGVYLWGNPDFLVHLETKLKENGFLDPHEIVEQMEIVAYPKKGIIEFYFEDLNLDPEITIVVAHAFMDEMLRSSADGRMKAIERRRNQLKDMYKELDQLPEDDWRHSQLSRAIEAVTVSGGYAHVSLRPEWKVRY